MVKKRIPFSKVTAGMILAEDISCEGFKDTLFRRETELDDNIIEFLKWRNIRSLEVYQEEEPRPPMSVDEFEQRYTDVINNCIEMSKNILNMEASSEEIDACIKNAMKFYNDMQGTNNLLNLLHCMHDICDSIFVHSLNVGIIASVIAKWSKMREEDCELVFIAGIFHDIGKLMIPVHILNKPGKLTRNEMKIMQQHSVFGYEIVKKYDIDERIKNVIIRHHEKIDGSGYPYGLKGREIDVYSKIVTIADVYEAMTADRVYRNGICPFDVISRFREEGFLLYDAKYLFVFLNNITNAFINSSVILNDTVEARVIMSNKEMPERPMVLVDDVFVDLAKERDIHIDRVKFKAV